MFFPISTTFPPSEFANERQRVESRKEFQRLKRQKAMDSIIENYLDWIYKAGEYLC